MPALLERPKMSACRNCEMPLERGRRFFCSDDCQREYHRRSQQPRPIPTRPPTVCQGCGQLLAGKQRKWCSEKCRSRARRDRESAAANQPDRPGLTANPQDRVGQIRSGQMTIRFRCTQITPGLGVYLPEDHLRRAELRRIYAELIEQVMNREVFGYVVTVEVK